MRSYIRGLLCVALCILIVSGLGCWRSKKSRIEKAEPVVVSFSLMLDDAVYSRTRYKKPPQFAIWMKKTEVDAETDEEIETIKTVWVTEKTGRGSWGGTTTRPMSLPVWVSQWNKETRTTGDPNPDNPAVDSVTGATPKGSFTIEVDMPGGGQWEYYIEVNVSGDFNETFAAETNDGKKDVNGNGQPSIIYAGTITLEGGQRSTPELIGRTEQFTVVTVPVDNMDGITTAAKLMGRIEVNCREKLGIKN